MLWNILTIVTLTYLINCLPPSFSSSGEFSCSFTWCLFLCLHFYVLGISAKTLVQTYVQCFLWLALGNMFGTISNPQLVASSLWPGVFRKKQSVHQGWLLPAPGPGVCQLKSSVFQRSTLTCRLSVKLKHWNCLQVYSSAPWLKLQRVGWDGFLQVGLLLPLKLTLGGECSNWERCLLRNYSAQGS